MARFVLPHAEGNAAATYLTSLTPGRWTPMISMCSANHPSLRACHDAMRSARHFLPSSALPPYALPTLQIVLSSGKCRMRRRLGLSPALECRHFVKDPSVPSCLSTGDPMRAMIRMFSTT